MISLCTAECTNGDCSAVTAGNKLLSRQHVKMLRRLTVLHELHLERNSLQLQLHFKSNSLLIITLDISNFNVTETQCLLI